MMMTVDDNDEIKISLMSVDTNNYRVLMDVRIWQWMMMKTVGDMMEEKHS